MSRRRLHFDRLVPARNREGMPDLQIAGLEAEEATGVARILARPHDMSLRDWAIFLLHSAAEVEHALMIQYLYAMYSLNRDLQGPSGNPPPAIVKTSKWALDIRKIAVEEMSHLVIIQNILRFIGGPLNFDREDFPVRSEVYPFPFQLEALTRDSLSKYVYAEMPVEQVDPSFINPPFLPAERQEIEERAMRVAGVSKGKFINHVGTLFATLIDVFSSPEFSNFATAGFPPDTDRYQARFGNPWQKTSGNSSLHPPGGTAPNLVGPRVLTINSLSDVLEALNFIAQQGEATGTNPTDSHFERFLKIYRDFPESGAAGWETPPAFPVLTNPNTGLEVVTPGTIIHKTTNLWARLFDLRYRILLTSLVHATAIPAYELQNGVMLPTADYARLVGWAYNEMADRTSLRLLDLALLLARMPSSNSVSGPTAGAPFSMPYSLAIPDRDHERWQHHLDLLNSSATLIAELQKIPSDPQFPIFDEAREALPDLLGEDDVRRDEIKARLNTI